MGTKSGVLSIVLPDTRELAQLPKFSEAAAELAILNGELSEIERTVREMKITDKVTFQAADILNKRAKEALKQAEEICKSYKTPLRKWLDLVQTQFNVVKNHVEQLSGILQPKMQVFSQQEARAAELERAKLQKDLDKQCKNTDTEAPKVKVESEVRGGRDNYTAFCNNQSGYIKAVCEAYKRKDHPTFDRLVLMLEVSDKRLAEEARNTKNDGQMEKWYPCVTATHSKSF